MRLSMYDYDVFPLVFPVGKEVTLTVKPQGRQADFPAKMSAEIIRLDAGCRGSGSLSNTKYENVSPCADGAVRLTYTAEKECEHFIRLYKEDGGRIGQFPVYALDADLACRRPFKGDLHMHTCRSDGHEDPATVCANYRSKQGYDFCVITDHRRYYPSLEAINTYEDAKLPMNILPGEEVHIPQTFVHIVNAGGLYSVNGLFADSSNYTETDGALCGRRFDESVDVPDIVSPEQYEEELKAIEAECENVPEDMNLRAYAVCVWAYRHIQKAGGLAVFAHPYWIADVWHVPESFTRYTLEQRKFDAFEVLGGENYYEQNGFQTAIYYDEYKNGNILPIVGSTDTHGSTENNRNSDICSTIVFAHKNERADLIQSIKDLYSVAVDSISKEYRLVGDFRLQKYASFLMENWYPIHDRLAACDGEIMRQYYVGEATADELTAISAKSEAQFAKYFAE